MYCRHCGLKIPDKSKICPHCGRSTNSAFAGQGTVQQNVPGQNANTRYCRYCALEVPADSQFCAGCGKNTAVVRTNTSTRKLPLILGIAAVAVVALIVAGVFLLRGQSDPQISAPDIDFPAVETTSATQAATIPATTAPAPSGIVDQSAPGWEDNILMADPVTTDDHDKAFASPVFGSEYKRNQIYSITFLDSRTNVPADCWDVSQAQNGSVIAWVEPAQPPEDWEGVTPAYDLYIAGEDGINAASACEGLFSHYKYMATLEFNDCFHTEGAQSMKDMFNFCRDLQTFDLSCFDTSSVTDMSYMFYSCCSPSQIDLSSFDTSNVTNMDYMFYAFTSGFNVVSVSGQTIVSSLDLSNFDTSNVTSMKHIFYSCSGLETMDLSSFDTSQITNMSAMFVGCSSLRTLDLTSFDTSSVTDMSSMFYSCESLEKLDLSSFDTSKVRNMNHMFLGANPDAQVTYDPDMFVTSQNPSHDEFCNPNSTWDWEPLFNND